MKPPGWYLALLLALLPWPGCVLTEEESHRAEVSISGTSVFVICPVGHETDPVKTIELKHAGKDIGFKTKERDHIFSLQNYKESNNGEYKCETTYSSNVSPVKIKLYLKAKVCELCVEMEIWTVVGILATDLLITLGVVLLVYYWSKNKKGRTEGAGGRVSKPKGYTKERPPPVPNPDYEPIRKGQRELYDGLNSRA